MDIGLGLTETMKNIVAKGIQTEMGAPYSGSGYVTEKLYLLLQIYLQNKGWNHSVELLQRFTELKDASMLPSASYLQMMASRITLDSQGRLILRENGKIILPFEHFANAVMLKHINGPHGLHLGLEATLRAIMDSYTIGRENFGMEKEFIMEVVNNCPNPACRYYNNQLDMSHNKPTYIPDPPSTVQTATNIPDPNELVETPINKSSTPLPPSRQQHKMSEFLKSNLESLETLTNANKDLLAVHNGSWMQSDAPEGKHHSSTNTEVGQEKIIRAFAEIMKNMNRMKTCVRPAMCKPYGKQSEALQKTLMDTIQLVQSLRSFLPPPHIAVSSWKNEDKHSSSFKSNNSEKAHRNFNKTSSNKDTSESFFLGVPSFLETDTSGSFKSNNSEKVHRNFSKMSSNKDTSDPFFLGVPSFMETDTRKGMTGLEELCDPSRKVE